MSNDSVLATAGRGLVGGVRHLAVAHEQRQADRAAAVARSGGMPAAISGIASGMALVIRAFIRYALFLASLTLITIAAWGVDWKLGCLAAAVSCLWLEFMIKGKGDDGAGEPAR